MGFPAVEVDIVLLVLATASAAVAVAGLGLAVLRPSPAQARLKAVLQERQTLSRQQKEQHEQARRRQRAEAQVGFMRRVVERLRLQGDATSRALRTRLARAGWRGQGPMIVYAFMRLCLPLGFGVAAALLVLGGRGIGLGPAAKTIVVLLGAGIGYALPAVIVANAAQRRQQALRRGFPDALDLLVICVEAGLSLDAAFARATEEMQETYPIVAEELGLTSAELAFLGDRRQALTHLAERTGLSDFRSLTTALIQSERYGTSLGLTLRVLAKENRDMRMMRALEKAGRLPATLTVPMVAFILPVLFIVLIGPAAIQALRTLY